MLSPALQEKLADLPERPGVYVYRNAAGEPIYVGKAKSLRQRVRSYFQPSAMHPPRIERMVSEVADLEIIVVHTEVEALILESNLVKKNKPRFNVVLRDDKNFPYLKLSLADTYPRVSLVRRAKVDANLYVGPFLPAAHARRTLKLIPRFFQVATCKEVFDGKRRPCLYYHLDQCLAPCAGKTTPEEYGQAVRHAQLFLEGRHHELEGVLEERMRDASVREEFEAAARYRDTLQTVRKLAVRQHMASVGLEEQDYFAYRREGGEAILQLFQMREGKVQARREFAFQVLDVDDAALYATALAQYYADATPPREIYVAVLPSEASLLEQWLAQRRGMRVHVRVPARGVKRQFLDLVAGNASLAFDARFRAPHTHGVEVAEALAEALGLEEPPSRIECFDISNVQGKDSVASLVVFEAGKPRKSDYRTFNVRGVIEPDDFASMAEVVTRRYRRLLAEDRRLPDLVLIDGGAGQLGAAVRALAAVGLPMLPVVSLAKREEEIYLQGGGEPVRLPKDSPALHLVQRVRDEAHRFALGAHRRRRTRRTLKTELTELPGVGARTARKLLRTFGSLEAVRRADRAALAAVVGAKVADVLVRRYGGGGVAG
ncbi:MAG TPA: excinuclease ABC subunit UvrC [Candidatus Polarisedimenticolaceae bacterium]|nr:excinuclease ABC subunit UvrC [Candidatus Polarisedimenticolaceae bacterium]